MTFGAKVLAAAVFVAALGMTGARAASGDNAILFGAGAGMLMVLYLIGAAAILGGIASVVNAAQRLVAGPGGIVARAGELVLAAAAIYGIWTLANYGLVSFNTVV
jgi:hypothetical protein